MVHEDGAGTGVESFDPVEEPLLIRVAAGAVEGEYLGVDGDALSEELHLFGPVEEGMAQGAHRLIAHKQDQILLVP